MRRTQVSSMLCPAIIASAMRSSISRSGVSACGRAGSRRRGPTAIIQSSSAANSGLRLRSKRSAAVATPAAPHPSRNQATSRPPPVNKTSPVSGKSLKAETAPESSRSKLASRANRRISRMNRISNRAAFRKSPTRPQCGFAMIAAVRGLEKCENKQKYFYQRATSTETSLRKRGCRLGTNKKPRPRPGLSAELVPEIGIEPTTYALRMRRSTN